MIFLTRLLPSLAFLLLAFARGSWADDNTITESPVEVVSKMPACAVTCFMGLIKDTTCGISDLECLCKDEKFHAAALKCVMSSCSIQQAFEIGGIEADACKRPKRSRKYETLLGLILQIPAWICPWIRLWSRWLTVGKWELDDYLMGFTGLIFTVFAVLGQYVGQLAFGVDVWTVKLSTLVKGMKLFYVAESFYLAGLCFCKVSVLYFYLRIFPNARFRYSVFAAMGLVVAPTIAFICAQVLQCVPIRYAWEGLLESDAAEHCVDLHILAYTQSGFNILQDLVILVLPIPLLLQLKIEMRNKIGIFAMFSLGIFITITSCVRLRYITSFFRSQNPTWDYVDVLVWTGLELSIAIIVACLPAIGVLLRRYVPSIFGSIKNSYRATKSSAKTSKKRAREQGPGYEEMLTGSTKDGPQRDEESQLDLNAGIELERKPIQDIQSAHFRQQSDRPHYLKESVVSAAGVLSSLDSQSFHGSNPSRAPSTPDSWHSYVR